MAGGGFSGLTSQTFRPLSCWSDKISFGNPARPHTSDVSVHAKRPKYHRKTNENQRTNSTFASPDPQADTSACKRAIFITTQNRL